jgi:hypothetical protein
MRTLVLIMACLFGAPNWSLVPPRSAVASMYIHEYDSLRHDRFSESDSAAFIGEGYDFSGVGHTSGNRWVTMISPTYFVSAAHRFPIPGTTVTFYEGNEKSDEFAHQYVIDDFTVTMFWNGQPSDLKVGKLVVPDGRTEAILPEEKIAWYPVISTEEFSYGKAELFVCGLADRVGKNSIDKICSLDNRDAENRRITQVMEFAFAPDQEIGFGADEAYLMTGDSGGPSFVVIDEKLALAGIHYYNYGPNPVIGCASGDSFVPAYLDQLTTFPINGDATGDQFVGHEDLNAIRLDWGICPDGAIAKSDLTGNGRIGIDDLNVVREHWRQTGPARWITSRDVPDPLCAVPEPSFWSLVPLLAFVLSGCRFHFGRR